MSAPDFSAERLPSLPRAYTVGLVSNRAERLTRLAGDAFTAWHGSGVPIDVSEAETLDEAVSLAKVQSGHKCNFVIQQDCRNARRFLHFYGVTKSTRHGTYRDSYDGGPRVFQGNCEAKHLMTMQVSAPLQPVPPWTWSNDDRTGEKHGLCPDLLAAMLVDG